MPFPDIYQMITLFIFIICQIRYYTALFRMKSKPYTCTHQKDYAYQNHYFFHAAPFYIFWNCFRNRIVFKNKKGNRYFHYFP